MTSQGRVFKWIETAFLISILSVFADSAFAWSTAITGSVIDRYGSCYWSENGDGTSTLRVRIDFKPAWDIPPRGIFQSRGILLYTYDKNGNMNLSSTPANSVTINGVHNKTIWKGGYGYLMYNGGLAWDQTPEWNKRGAFVADVEVVINNSVVSDWPALSIRAGNYTDDTHVVEITGGAYLGRFGTASNCTVIDPETPPPPPDRAQDERT